MHPEDDLGPLPTIHPREAICTNAEDDLFSKIIIWRRMWRKVSGLTATEEMSIIQHVLSSQVGGAFKHAIRVERHGTADKPGGIV